MKRLTNAIKGRPALQPFLEKLHPLLLHAMGIGTGGEAETGGETVALQYIKQKLYGTARPVLFDVGANRGNYTKLLAEMFPNANIFAFEPSPKTFETLRDMCPSSVKVLNIGLSDSSEKAILYTNKNNSAIASIYKRNLTGKHTLDETEKIELDTVDNFCAKNHLSSVELLKLDVEGNELKCLHGAQQMLSENKIRFIQFEFGGCNVDSRTFFRDFYELLKENYRIWRIMQHGLYEIKQYGEIREQFITTNYLAEHK